MTAHEYQTGGWTALVTDGALALLHPGVADDVARELWQLTTTGRRLGAWVEYLASRGIATLPSFAMVESHPDGLRVLVRGEVDVEIAGRSVSARGYATWREEVVPAATDVTIRAAADDGGWLPLTGGIVRAAAVRLAVDQRVPAAPLEEEDDDVELTVARMPALAAAVAGASASTPAEAEDAAPSASESEPEPEPEPVNNSAVGAGGGQDPAVGAEGGQHSAVGVGGGNNSAVGAEDGEEEAEDSDDYDFLLWSTEQVQAREETPAAEPVPDPEPEPVAESAPEPPPAPAEDTGQPDLEATREPEPEEHGGTTDGIIDSVPGRLRPAGPPPPAPVPPTPPAAPLGLPVDLPPPDDGDHDGETILASDLPVSDVEIAVEPERPATLLELVLSTGPRIEMDRPVLLGRAPEAARFAGTEVPRLVSVSNPERDISSTHAEIRPAGDHVVVTDLNSTNGTVVHRADQPSVRLQPGTGMPVGEGAVVELGAGVTVTVERPEGAQ